MAEESVIPIIWDEIRPTPLSDKAMKDIIRFDCSDQPIVEEFLKKDALRLENCNACKTTLLYYKGEIIGYYTLFTDYVNLVNSKRKQHETWKSVATAMDSQHFPAIRLHFLGVNKGYRDQRVGEMLVLFALNTCVYISKYVGFAFVTLEALESSVGFFEKQNFEVVKKARKKTLGELTVMAIKLDDIKGAGESQETEEAI